MNAELELIINTYIIIHNVFFIFTVGLCKVKRAYLSEESLSRVKAWSKQQAHSGVQVNRPDVVHPIETQHTAKLRKKTAVLWK